MRTFSRCAFSAIVVLSTSALPALADQDGKGYPGSLCRPAEPAMREFFQLQDGKIFNISLSQTLRLSCPIVKDIDRIGGAQVRVVDFHPTAAVACTLRTFRNDGAIQQQASAASAGATFVPQQLQYAAQSAPGGGYYELECSVPPRNASGSGSSVVMYNIVEVN